MLSWALMIVYCVHINIPIICLLLPAKKHKEVIWFGTLNAIIMHKGVKHTRCMLADVHWIVVVP